MSSLSSRRRGKFFINHCFPSPSCRLSSMNRISSTMFFSSRISLSEYIRLISDGSLSCKSCSRDRGEKIAGPLSIDRISEPLAHPIGDVFQAHLQAFYRYFGLHESLPSEQHLAKKVVFQILVFVDVFLIASSFHFAIINDGIVLAGDSIHIVFAFVVVVVVIAFGANTR
ncbi:hypothetical protein E6O75_ATG10418 [Venturia nashicola]|uniref:Uncharacterized protein n=1 Tax=Venturia nashicola TaxID=86259 RepID=A0A4Z1P6T5_9PEZI|nr:hypothetical protein E6O75_ATG10418 [Venturia nashicola]